MKKSLPGTNPLTPSINTLLSISPFIVYALSLLSSLTKSADITIYARGMSITSSSDKDSSSNQAKPGTGSPS